MMMRTFTVSKVLMGYIVTIGCQTCAFSEDRKDEMLKRIDEYVNNPDATEQKYYNEPQVVATEPERLQPVGDALGQRVREVAPPSQYGAPTRR
jgi:hypothetical protein